MENLDAEDSSKKAKIVVVASSAHPPNLIISGKRQSKPPKNFEPPPHIRAKKPRVAKKTEPVAKKTREQPPRRARNKPLAEVMEFEALAEPEEPAELAGPAAEPDEPYEEAESEIPEVIPEVIPDPPQATAVEEKEVPCKKQPKKKKKAAAKPSAAAAKSQVAKRPTSKKNDDDKEKEKEEDKYEYDHDEHGFVKRAMCVQGPNKDHVREYEKGILRKEYYIETAAHRDRGRVRAYDERGWLREEYYTQGKHKGRVRLYSKTGSGVLGKEYYTEGEFKGLVRIYDESGTLYNEQYTLNGVTVFVNQFAHGIMAQQNYTDRTEEETERHTERHYDSHGRLHRDGGAAVLYEGDLKMHCEWLKRGRLHRDPENGVPAPAVFYHGQLVEYFIEGKRLRLVPPNTTILDYSYSTADKTYITKPPKEDVLFLEEESAVTQEDLQASSELGLIEAALQHVPLKY